MVMAFIIWALLSVCFIGYGIYLMFSNKKVPVGFWANVKELPQVTDVKAYNKALGKLWCGYGTVLLLLGFPFLGEQNAAGFIITLLGTVWASIGLAIIYSTAILNKYQKK